MEMGVKCHTPATLPQGNIIGTHCTEAGWAPGQVWIAVENLTPTRIQALDCEASRKLMYCAIPAHIYHLYLYFDKNIAIYQLISGVRIVFQSV